MNLSESYKNRLKELSGLNEEFKHFTTFEPIPEDLKRRYSSFDNAAVFKGKDGQNLIITLENKNHVYVRVYKKTENGMVPVGSLFLYHDDKNNTFSPDAGKSDAVYVEPEFRKLGIARAMYEFAEKSGINITPSGVQAQEIQNFWNSREKLEENDRQLGPKLSNKEGKKLIWVYRAVANDALTFKDKDYVTLSKKFAVEHAENNHVYNEEQQQVIRALISTENLYDAYNHGEYFYSGPETKGRTYYKTKGLDYEGYDELTSSDFI